MDQTQAAGPPFSVEAVFGALAQARLDGDVVLLERPSRGCSGALTDLLYELDPHGALVWLPDGLGWDPVVEPGAQLDRLWHAGLRWSLAGWPDAAAGSASDLLLGRSGAGEPGAPALRLCAQTRADPWGLITHPVVPVEAGEPVALRVEALAADVPVELIELISDLDGPAGATPDGFSRQRVTETPVSPRVPDGEGDRRALSGTIIWRWLRSGTGPDGAGKGSAGRREAEGAGTPGTDTSGAGRPDVAGAAAVGKPVHHTVTLAPKRHGYVRARCRDARGRWRYTAPLFLELRPPAGERPFAVAWQWGDPGATVPVSGVSPSGRQADRELHAGQTMDALAAPLTLGRAGDLEDSPSSAAGSRAAASRGGAVEASLIVEQAGWHMLWVGVHAQDGSWAKGVPATMEIALAVEDGEVSARGEAPALGEERDSLGPPDVGDKDAWRLVGVYQAWHATDLPAATRAPRRWVPYNVALGWLAAGRHRLRFSSDAPGGGIALGYALVIRSPFPRLGVMAAHAHSTASGAHSYYPARSLGYDLILTAEVSEGHLPTLWQQCLARSDTVPGGLQIRPGYEHADCFADHHLGPLFLPANRLAETAPVYHNPHVPGWSIHRGAVPSLFHPHYIFTEPDGVPGTVFLSPGPRSPADADWRSPWTDQAHHGSGCWTFDHEGGHEGYSPFYWRTVPLFELWNAMSGENQDGLPYINWSEQRGTGWVEQWKRITRPSQFRGPGSAYWPIVRKWHEALDAYCAGQRPAPLFAMADLDSQTRADPTHVEEVLGHRRATLVYLLDPDASYESYRAAVSRGNTAALCQHDTVLLVCATDADGQLFAPGHHIGPEARWPLTIHVLAWAPRPIVDLRLTGPDGTLFSATPRACVVTQTWELHPPAHVRASGLSVSPTSPVDHPGASATGGNPVTSPPWFRVECYGNERYWGVAATTNPFFVQARQVTDDDVRREIGPMSIYRYRASGAQGAGPVLS